MTAQPKQEMPNAGGRPGKDRPEIPRHPGPKPETTGKGKPGTMPENPASIDHERDPAGIDPATDRSKQR